MGIFNKGDKPSKPSGDEQRKQPTPQQQAHQRREHRAAARQERRDGLAAEFDRIAREKGDRR